MGELIRNFDWSQTSLGEPDVWPQSLRTAVGIVISSAFPMLLWWGDELIQFYNDAFRPSLGTDGKHPSSLGQPAIGYWKENWHIIKPLIDKVMLYGEPSYFEDLPIPNWRNGRIEEVYWTFSYSPVMDESGKPAAVLMTCFETTQAVVSRRRLEESEARFRLLIEEAPVAMSTSKGRDYVVEIANEKMFEIWARKPEQILGKPVFEAMPEAKGQGFEEILKRIYNTGEPFRANEIPISLIRNGKQEAVYLNVVY